MKIIPKTNPKCPVCNTIPKKKGFRKNNQRIIQRYLCKSCSHSFTPQPPLQKHKTYPINIILNTISNLNLGYSLKQTQSYFKGKKHNQKTKIPTSTLSYWYSQLKPHLPYHRIRNKIKKSYSPIDIIKKKQFIHHNQPFTYQYHQPKLDLFLNSYPKLKHYLENIETLLPKDIFNNSIRISQISKTKETPTTRVKTRVQREIPYKVWNFPLRVGHFDKGKMTVFEPNVVVGVSLSKSKLTQKQNYATKLAQIALQITKDNKQRHNIIENLMLKNDTATIATEIPVYLKLKNNTITGHIDILQIRYKKLHILDFKPEKINKEQTITQLYLYAAALSKITSIPLKKFQCAFFNNKAYYEFCPKFLSGIPR